MGGLLARIGPANKSRRFGGQRIATDEKRNPSGGLPVVFPTRRNHSIG